MALEEKGHGRGGGCQQGKGGEEDPGRRIKEGKEREKNTTREKMAKK